MSPVSAFARAVANVRAAISGTSPIESAPRMYEPGSTELCTILDNMLEGCQIVDREWRYVYLNDAVVKQAKRTREELLGRTMMEMFPGIELTPMFADLERCMRERIPKRMENQFTFPDGTIGWFELRMEPVEEGVFILSLDITERKTVAEAEAKITLVHGLEEANKELEAFSYTVSHDLRAPLRAIDGFAKILAEDYGHALDDKGRQVIQTICDNARNMSALIDDLLAFSRLGMTELATATIDMEEIARSTFEELREREGGKRDVHFILEKLPRITGDAALLRQVWENLLSNALKFTSLRERAEITVEYRVDDDFVTYIVRDNGAGFDMRYAGKLFGVFQRLHAGKEFDGTGVGLAIVDRIVRRHGGRVWGEGAVGRGATFCFSLPRGKRQSESQKNSNPI